MTDKKDKGYTISLKRTLPTFLKKLTPPERTALFDHIAGLTAEAATQGRITEVEIMRTSMLSQMDKEGELYQHFDHLLNQRVVELQMTVNVTTADWREATDD